MQLDIKPASDYPVTDLFRFLNLSFENYLIPIQFNINQFLGMLRKDGIDLNTSRVLLVDDEPSGTALIARRGWTSRLAAMGVMKEARGKKAGSWLMEQLIKEARARNDREMTLEVIEQNEPAVRLYKRSNFQTIRRLIGFAGNAKSDNPAHQASHLQEIDLREMGRLILQHGLPDLPWQFSGETIALLNPPARAYRNGQAYIAISDPSTENVVIWSLLVETAARGQGLAAEMLQDVMATFPNKQWHVPAILPEELGFVFERAGFQREELSQWQMRLML
jgi:ribosomal protein S18 acetylase RimI-like enzyme/predicted GNAT family acetyltransferase